jgi:hypothetical protein
MREILRVNSAYHPAAVERIGDVVVRDANPWTPTVHALARHFEAVGFNGAPRLVGTGFDESGMRETLTYIHGTFFQPGPWSIEGAASVGRLLREMHSASASFRAPADAVWFPWFGRSLGDTPSVIGHCDLGPWNIVARDGLAVALIDWERAGPVDPVVELAHACWLNAKLHDELVAEMEGLPPLDVRAAQLRAIVDGYGLPAAKRNGFVDLMIGLAVHDAADEADMASITRTTRPDSLDPQVPWGLAWRIRAAAWQWRHRNMLQRSLL